MCSSDLSPLEFAFESDYGGGRPLDGALAGARQVTSEPWFGESPYGAQGELPASYSLMVTGFSEACHINGFYVCPVIEVNELPASALGGVRARLHALGLAGARSVLTEIAAWNLPSLHLAYAHGFAKVAEMWVETTRTTRVAFGLRRR